MLGPDRIRAGREGSLWTSPAVGPIGRGGLPESNHKLVLFPRRVAFPLLHKAIFYLSDIHESGKSSSLSGDDAEVLVDGLHRLSYLVCV